MFEAVLIAWLAIAQPRPPEFVQGQDAWALSLCGKAFMYVWKEPDGTLWLVTPESAKTDLLYRQAFEKMMNSPGTIHVIQLEEKISGVLCVRADLDDEKET